MYTMIIAQTTQPAAGSWANPIDVFNALTSSLIALGSLILAVVALWRSNQADTKATTARASALAASSAATQTQADVRSVNEQLTAVSLAVPARKADGFATPSTIITLMLGVVALLSLAGCNGNNPEKVAMREGLWAVAEPSMKQTVVLMEDKQKAGLASSTDVLVWQRSYDEAAALVTEDRARDNESQQGLLQLLGLGKKSTAPSTKPAQPEVAPPSQPVIP